MIRRINEENKEEKKKVKTEKEIKEWTKKKDEKQKKEKNDSKQDSEASHGTIRLGRKRNFMSQIQKNNDDPIGRHFGIQTSSIQKVSAGEKLKTKNRSLEKEGEVGARKATRIGDLIGRFEGGRDGKTDRNLDLNEMKSERKTLDNWLGLARGRSDQ